MNKFGQASLLDGLSTWGLWPALVMTLSQWEAAHLLHVDMPRHLILITLSGVFSIYGADRFLERKLQAFTEARHRGHLVVNSLFLILIPGVALWVAPQLTLPDLIWICILGIAGVCYLLATLNIMIGGGFLKEFLGAFCFTFLVWGRLPLELGYLVAFGLMGLSNFLWSGYQDMPRDRANGVPSFALKKPGLNLLAARLSAMVATVLFLALSGVTSAFFWVSLLHAFWPRKEQAPVDLAFIPLIVVLTSI